MSVDESAKLKARNICLVSPGGHRTFLVINGPNLNLLGEREPSIYGVVTLRQIEDACISWGKRRNADVICFQSNTEGALVDFLQEHRHDVCGVVFNPAAYTHTSIALRDCVAALPIPVIEVHISNIASREDFRKHSHIAPVAVGQISGLGPMGYILALEALEAIIDERGISEYLAINKQ